MSKRLSAIWHGMRTRCNNKNHVAFERYGGRGIKICPEWNSYNSFRQWAEMSGYNDSLFIDRIDNNKGYSPDNCRWVDKYVQANNRSNNRKIEIDGEEKTIAEWSRISGVKPQTIRERLERGWNNKRAVFTVAKTSGYKIANTKNHAANHITKVTVDGVERSIAETARHYGVSYPALLHRIKRGATPQSAVDALCH